MSAPVCLTCLDTHQMALDDRTVLCTHCPVPCNACAVGGVGAYCATTPCTCVCHGRPVGYGQDARSNRIENLTRLRDQCAANLEECLEAFKRNQLDFANVKLDTLFMWLDRIVEKRQRLAEVERLITAEY